MRVIWQITRHDDVFVVGEKCTGTASTFLLSGVPVKEALGDWLLGTPASVRLPVILTVGTSTTSHRHGPLSTASVVMALGHW